MHSLLEQLQGSAFHSSLLHGPGPEAALGSHTLVAVPWPRPAWHWSGTATQGSAAAPMGSSSSLAAAGSLFYIPLTFMGQPYL